MRCRAAVHSPDVRTVMGRVRGQISYARSLTLSVSVRVKFDQAPTGLGVGVTVFGGPLISRPPISPLPTPITQSPFTLSPFMLFQPPIHCHS